MGLGSDRRSSEGRSRGPASASRTFPMMLELQRQYPVRTPIGYGWVTICSKESGLANDLWTVVMEKDGAHCHFRSDQIFALPNGTLDINTTKENSGTIPFKSEPHNHTTNQAT
jgi:hypothetical protein